MLRRASAHPLALAFVFAVTCVGISGRSSPAGAQTSQAEIEASKKVAAAEADRAFVAFQAKKYAEAIEGFRRADRAFHAPKFLLYVARAQAKMDKLRAAKATYESVINEKLTSYAPPEFFSAQSDAKKELAELKKRIPSVRIERKGPITAVALDGDSVSDDRLETAILVDPGEHTVTARGPGGAEIKQRFSIAEKETRTVTIEAREAPVVPSATVDPLATAPVPTDTGPGPDKPSPRSGPPTGTWIAYGAGALGLVAGGVFGGLAVTRKGELDTLLAAPKRDETQIQDLASQGRLFAGIADAGFATAIVGAAAGTILWIVSAPKEKPAEPAGSARVLLFPQVSPTSGGAAVVGTF